MTESELLALLRARKTRGMESLMLHYGPLMRYIIAPILQDPQEREECLSDAAMRVWDKIELFDAEKGDFKGWLSSVVRNTARGRAKRSSRGDGAEMTEELPDAGAGPEETLLRRERADALREALGRIDANDRLIFYRKYYYMQSTAQIASELGLTERAVEGRLYRAKSKLRKLLGGDARD